MATKTKLIITLPFNKVFKPANLTKKRYRVIKGSAGSGKSVNVAQDYILKLSDPKYKGANLLCVRKVGESNRHSTFAELKQAIRKTYKDKADRYWYINESNMTMKSLVTGNEIIFRGILNDRDREKMKSITFEEGKLTWIWVEEATELYEADLDILDDRLRGILPNVNLYYQITLTFNPISAQHWIKRKFFDYKDDETFTHHSTYMDNRFIDEGYKKRMHRRKVQDPDGYRIYGLGEWGEVGGLVLSNYVVERFERGPECFDFMVNAQDFGFNHANAILEVGFKDGELYICRESYEFEKETNELIEVANKLNFRKHLIMWCDSAEPDRIKMWKKAGYKARPVKKDKGSVSGQLAFLKTMKIHIHPSCINTAKEIGQWKYKKNEKTGKYEDEPVNVFDDAMAALRYSIESIRRNVNPQQSTPAIDPKETINQFKKIGY
jgi:phage terminase large subunit